MGTARGIVLTGRDVAIHPSTALPLRDSSIGKQHGVTQDLSASATQSSASWNQISVWLTELDGLRHVA
jgi:hypothetical protein